MKRKKWASKTKWLIVLEGLKGKAISEICAEHGLSQAQYYKWRDQFLSEGHKVFDKTKDDQKQSFLAKENGKLKKLVGDLTYELKKSDELWE